MKRFVYASLRICWTSKYILTQSRRTYNRQFSLIIHTLLEFLRQTKLCCLCQEWTDQMSRISIAATKIRNIHFSILYIKAITGRWHTFSAFHVINKHIHSEKVWQTENCMIKLTPAKCSVLGYRSGHCLRTPEASWLPHLRHLRQIPMNPARI